MSKSAKIWNSLYNIWCHEFRGGNVSIFRRVAARIVGTHPILGIVQLASIGGIASAIGAISSVLVPIAALALIRVVRRLRRLRTAAAGTSTTATSLWGTTSFNYSSFKFSSLDGEIEIGKEITLVHRRTGQIVNRCRRSVGPLAVEVQKRLHFNCQTNCVLNRC